MSSDSPKPLVISDYDPTWAARFRDVGRNLRDRAGDDALRVDHIGSTAVPGLPAKDLIDVQITVRRLEDADAWPDELLEGLTRRSGFTDHHPAGCPSNPGDWDKRYWTQRNRLHVHVREDGRPNQRYALLFRDFLRADSAAAGAYGRVKRALAQAAPNDWDTYYEVKDPACDLIMAGAEQWARRVDWVPPPSDA